jgi:hypothetical protein
MLLSKRTSRVAGAETNAEAETEAGAEAATTRKLAAES